MAKVRKSRNEHLRTYETLVEYDGALCFWCQKALGTQVHHILPRAFFGKKKLYLQESYQNLCLVCAFCHGNDILSSEKARAELLRRKARLHPDWDYSGPPWNRYIHESEMIDE